MTTNTELIEPTNLNMLFCDLIYNFAHLVKVQAQTKKEFIEEVKKTYSTDNPKTALFVESIKQSTFNTIRLNRTKTSILFNQ
jgi:hypothetical protein